MARTPRCLVDDLSAEPVRLTRDAAHHLERVLRLRPGEPVELVDGAGGRAHARWVAGGTLDVHTHEPRRAPPAHGPRLFVAPPKGARLDGLVEKAVELGALELHLLRTRFAGPEPNAARWERLRRKADEALLQCRGLHRLALGEPLALADALAGARGETLWFGSAPDDAGTADAGPPEIQAGAGRLNLFVGPEGGWSPEEALALRAARARPVRLGERVLRVETAALALLALAGARSSTPDRGTS